MKHMQLLVAQAADDGAASLESLALGDTGPNPMSLINERLRTNLDVLNHPGSLGDILGQINIVWAVIFLVLGALCIVNGYRWHRFVIMLLAALAGVWAGMAVGTEVGSQRVVAACFAVLAAVISWPMMKFSVALFGGLMGAFAGANIWTAVGQNPDQHHIGALVGLIVLGMLAFVAFRLVVILLTTMGGASLLVLGGLAAMMQVESWQGGMVSSMESNRLLVPIVVGSAALLGTVFQWTGGLKGMKEMAEKADPKAVKKKPAAA